MAAFELMRALALPCVHPARSWLAIEQLETVEGEQTTAAAAASRRGRTHDKMAAMRRRHQETSDETADDENVATTTNPASEGLGVSKAEEALAEAHQSVEIATHNLREKEEKLYAATKDGVVATEQMIMLCVRAHPCIVCPTNLRHITRVLPLLLRLTVQHRTAGGWTYAGSERVR